MENMFRDLKESEIDVRIATVNSNGLSLLLYKDARVDQDILDETINKCFVILSSINNQFPNLRRAKRRKSERLY